MPTPGRANVLDDLDHLVDLDRIEASHHLVEQQELWPHGKRLRELEPFSVRSAERLGALIGTTVETRERRSTRAPLHARFSRESVPPSLPNKAPTVTFSRTDKPGNGFITWKVRPMPRWAAAVRRQAVDARALEPDLALVGRKRAADQVDERRLAGAVGPDQPEDLAACERETDVVDRYEPLEASGYWREHRAEAMRRRS